GQGGLLPDRARHQSRRRLHARLRAPRPLLRQGDQAQGERRQGRGQGSTGLERAADGQVGLVDAGQMEGVARRRRRSPSRLDHPGPLGQALQPLPPTGGIKRLGRRVPILQAHQQAMELRQPEVRGAPLAKGPFLAQPLHHQGIG
ncbi:MAG: hypothetical protein ACK559_00490, partial [bacterium]